MTSRRSNKISHGARAVITGAGSGIGRSFALELARRNAAVVCSDKFADRAEETAELVRAAGGTAFATVCDVAARPDVEKLAAAADEMFGAPPTLVVNNAGVGAGGHLIGEIGFDEWYWVLGINLLGVVHGCEVFAPQLRAQKQAGIINIASAAAYSAAPLMAAYSASKAAVLSLSETLRSEMVGTGVHVTVVCPTFVKTNVARDGRIAGNAATYATTMMERRGTAPEVIARKSLDANDAGRLYVMPQLDAWLGWRLKRLAPALTTRAMAKARNVMDPQ
ncbi:short-chain dehydrogenase [Mycolicibacter minnesotensis]|uniref:Short-chain dehydrogenase n=1 Tax=Mycolicibacter minnesotensis TaxID=1118379 RepID=A0A7I7R4S5_9MYCO|nr:SDR family NAD(P)-dependent oxidoreductase [Mycolicibacter minnesotensis]ORA99940.1 short-chain dehydrogenase [Mycolicibacter minnesotensis]BBY33628.1 putative short chain dehydrogenase/reductase [Mycolicibacter minnesotensis]